MKILYIGMNFTEVFPKGPIDNEAALDQVMVWCRTGDKPLPDAMLAKFIAACMRYYGEMS